MPPRFSLNTTLTLGVNAPLKGCSNWCSDEEEEEEEEEEEKNQVFEQ